MNMSDYNICWDSQGKSSADSMPVGGHDVGCNVWVQDDQICIFLSQSGSFDENGTMLKLGRVRIWLQNKRIFQKNFRQILELENGGIRIEAGEDGEKVSFLIWVDVTNGNVHIDFDAKKEQKVFLSFDCWRYREREVLPEERGQCRNLSTVLEDPLEETVTTYPDCVMAEKNGLWFWHDNRKERLIYDRLIKQQGLEAVKNAFPNWLKGRITGGYLGGKHLCFQETIMGEMEGIDQKEYHYMIPPVSNTEIMIALETDQFLSVEDWKREVCSHQKSGCSLRQNQKWWRNYFSKSFILIDKKNKNSPEWKIGRNYQLFRYMLGCNYYGKWPTKFNGGLFTFVEGYTPDYRNWSGSDFTAQNQRLAYWPALKCGDFEAMRTQLDFYNHILMAGKARAEHYWGHKGAYFPEQISCFGTSIGAEYKWNRRRGIPAGEDDSPWVRMHYSTALEFSLMMLAYGDFSGEDVSEYIDFIDNVVRFYFEHYGRDDENRLYIFPSTALETYKQDANAEERERYGVANPMDAVAGIRCVLGRLIACLEKKGLDAQQYKSWLALCPELPRGEENGKEVFMPAQKYNPVPFNCELPQLYSVFPFGYEGLSQEDIDTGRNTYNSPSINKEQKLLISWHQNGIFAAKLKMKEEAHRILNFKLGDADKKFPAFWGPGHDWTPDHNWGGSGMIGLQEMLLQVNGDGYEVLPCWDRNIDVHFRLFLPAGKVVECRLEDGEVSIREECYGKKESRQDQGKS